MHDGRADRGAVAPVALVNILDHFLAPLVLEVDVDIGRLAAVLGNEAGEQKLGLFRIDRGDAEAKTHGAVGRRAAALAENFFVLPARVVHDVVHGEEIARVVELGDQGELIVEPFLHVGRNAVGIFVLRIALLCARPGEIFQMLLGGLAGRHRLVGIFVLELTEREAAGFGDLGRAGDRVGKAGEQPRHFRRAFQMPFRVDGKPQARFGHGAFLAHAGEHVGKRPALRHVIENVIHRNERRADLFAELGQQAEPARLVAAMIMNAGEKRTPRRGLDEGGEAGCKPLIPAKAGTQSWVPAFAGMSGGVVRELFNLSPRRGSLIPVTLRCERSEPRRATAREFPLASFEARAKRGHLRMTN